MTERGDCWPSPLQTCLLRAALLTGDAAMGAWHEWQSRSSIDQLDPGSLRLLPLLYRNLVRLDVATPLFSRLKRLHRQAWSRNQVLFLGTARAVSALEDAGIPALLLKGVPLAACYYGTCAVRPMADADILVQPADVSSAVRVLRSVGWVPTIDPGRWPVEPLASWSFVHTQVRHQELDLHWRVFAESFQSDAPLWERSRPFDLCGITARMLAPPELLLHVLVHGILWNPVPPIRWVADAMAIVETEGNRFDWDVLLGLAERRKFYPVLTRGLTYLQSVMALQIPREVNQRLNARQVRLADKLVIAARTRSSPAWAACRVWLDYRRFAADHQRRTSPAGCWQYLESLWLPGRSSSLSSVIAEKIAGRMRHRRQKQRAAKV